MRIRVKFLGISNHFERPLEFVISGCKIGLATTVSIVYAKPIDNCDSSSCDSPLQQESFPRNIPTHWKRWDRRVRRNMLTRACVDGDCMSEQSPRLAFATRELRLK